MPMFSVTYDIVTQESAERGDVEDQGFIAQGLSLREAIKEVFETRTSRCAGVTSIEPASSYIEDSRWFTVCNGMEYETGAYESRSLHVPDSVTNSSRHRIARLIGVPEIFFA